MANTTRPQDAEALPTVVVGAGPVGLAAAAHLNQRGIPFLILEAGETAGSTVRQWAHVTMFSPWRYNIDPVSRSLLEGTDWVSPDPDTLPSGQDLVHQYLLPLAAHPAIAPNIRYNSRVAAIGRKGVDKVKTDGRSTLPFEIHLADGQVIEASSVIDASGTWLNPNPMGAGGIKVPGEEEHQDVIHYGIPDVLGRDRDTYAGKRTVVVGSGHSAMNAVLDLLSLADQAPGGQVSWIMRRTNLTTVFGGGEDDALPARGRLGQRAKEGVKSGRLNLLSPFRVGSVESGPTGLTVSGVLNGAEHRTEADRVVVATGFRSDLAMLREVRLSLDSNLESVADLAPLIDPNIHSCGTVRPHGFRELSHPDEGFFILGAKSYGRAPTFLLATGFEQARSVVAHLAGDTEAADRVELNLPETGVCSSDQVEPDETVGACCGPTPTIAAPASQMVSEEIQADSESEGCCGGPAPSGTDACCVKDADAKAAGEDGCGCGSDEAPHSSPEEVLIGADSTLGMSQDLRGRTTPSRSGGGCC